MQECTINSIDGESFVVVLPGKDATVAHAKLAVAERNDINTLEIFFFEGGAQEALRSDVLLRSLGDSGDGDGGAVPLDMFMVTGHAVVLTNDTATATTLRHQMQPGTTRLHLAFCTGLRTEGWRAIQGPESSAFEGLMHVNVSSCKLQQHDPNLRDMTLALSAHQTLRLLDVSQNPVNGGGWQQPEWNPRFAESLAAVVDTHPSLTSLNAENTDLLLGPMFGRSDLRSGAVDRAEQRLGAGGWQLQWLNMAGARFPNGTDTATAMFEALRTNTALTHLGLAGCEMCDGAEDSVALALVRALAHSLEVNRSLVSLDLSGNKLPPSTGPVLARTLDNLETNACLTRLMLTRNRLGPQGVRSLCEAVRENTTLTALGLSGNTIGRVPRHTGGLSGRTVTAATTEGAEAVERMLAGNTTLRELSLSTNWLGAQGAACVASGLRANRTLTSLEMSRNRVCTNGNQCAVTEMLKALTGSEGAEALCYLDLRDNDIPGSVRAEFVAAASASLQLML